MMFLAIDHFVGENSPATFLVHHQGDGSVDPVTGALGLRVSQRPPRPATSGHRLCLRPQRLGGGAAAGREPFWRNGGGADVASDGDGELISWMGWFLEWLDLRCLLRCFFSLPYQHLFEAYFWMSVEVSRGSNVINCVAIKCTKISWGFINSCPFTMRIRIAGSPSRSVWSTAGRVLSICWKATSIRSLKSF